jgi:flagellar basal-body rod protein FlgB
VTNLGSYGTTAMLEHALPILEATHRILANNVANADTPNFVPTHVSFSESLREALQGVNPSVTLTVTNSRHIPSANTSPSLAIEPDTYEPGRNDGSTFDVDTEMVGLLKNSIKYQMFSGILTKKYQEMRTVLNMP